MFRGTLLNSRVLFFFAIAMTTIITIATVMAWSGEAHAGTCEAGRSSLTSAPLRRVMEIVAQQNWRFKEKGLAFGFVSIESCMYVSDSALLIKNYCYPKRNYPARGYTLIAEAFGVVEFYEEIIAQGATSKREIRIVVFPEYVQGELPQPLSLATLSTINRFLGEAHKALLPACWSSNRDYQFAEPQVGCYKTPLLEHEKWAQETQRVVQSAEEWSSLMEQLRITSNESAASNKPLR